MPTCYRGISGSSQPGRQPSALYGRGPLHFSGPTLPQQHLLTLNRQWLFTDLMVLMQVHWYGAQERAEIVMKLTSVFRSTPLQRKLRHSTVPLVL